MSLVYYTTHCRMGAWLVGVYAGYVLHSIRGKSVIIPKVICFSPEIYTFITICCLRPDLGSDWLDHQHVNLYIRYICKLSTSSSVVQRLSDWRCFLRINQSCCLVRSLGMASVCLYSRIWWTSQLVSVAGRLAALGPYVLLHFLSAFAIATHSGCTGEDGNLFWKHSSGKWKKTNQ